MKLISQACLSSHEDIILPFFALTICWIIGLIKCKVGCIFLRILFFSFLLIYVRSEFFLLQKQHEHNLNCRIQTWKMASQKLKEKWARGGRPQTQHKLELEEVQQRPKNREWQRKYWLNCRQNDLIKE
jgi:uncharacterized membrane protein